jgi:predicted TIM-barrel fold metal-dependent hydrolase
VNTPIIDAHHHIWRLAETAWLQGPMQPRIFGAYEPLRRDYLIEEFLDEVVPCQVVKSVFVQVNVAPGKEVDEVAWVQSVADRTGFPHAICAFANLAAPDVGDVLDRSIAAGNTRSVRQQLHWHEDSRYRFAEAPDVFDRPEWRRGLAEVQDRSLMFELQVFPGQMAGATKLARAFPGVTFILLHAGMIVDRSSSGWEQWRSGMQGLADCPNVRVKLSGLGTFDRACSEERWREVIEPTIEMFGPSRCLFGSNFPIEKLWTDYETLIGVTLACLSHLSPGEQAEVMHDTAARLYRL